MSIERLLGAEPARHPGTSIAPEDSGRSRLWLLQATLDPPGFSHVKMSRVTWE